MSRKPTRLPLSLAILPSFRTEFLARVEQLDAMPPEERADLTYPEVEALASTRGRGDAPTSIAVVPMHGVIFAVAPRRAEDFGIMGLNILKARLEAVKREDSVASVLLDIDSPGGSVMGLREMAAYLRSYPKPIYGIANHLAASAAYWLGSQTKALFATPSAVVGSIGVITEHQDISGLMEQMGVRIEQVYAGKKKAQFSDLAPLSEEARAELQAQVDDIYAYFVQDVAKGRATSVKKVLSDYGEGGILASDKALSAGMVDYIQTPEEALATVMRRGKANATVTVAEAPVTTLEPVQEPPVIKGLHPSVAEKEISLYE